jgi:flavin-dependent dehydrogenase
VGVVDVLVVGAGPAGSVAATILARAGVRVRIVDRARFPRPKLCGDTVNPGTLAILRRLGLAEPIESRGLRVDGMRVTGPGAVVVEGRYPPQLYGIALSRRDLDGVLLEGAIAAGAQFEPGVVIRGALRSSGRTCVVEGIRVAGAESERQMRAPVTIAADGRRSTIAFGLGLARHPPAPRRWAIGGHVEGPAGMDALGEMHVRAAHYIGLAALPGGPINVCLVRPFARGLLGDPAAVLGDAVRGDPILRERFGAFRLVAPPAVLGPLAVDRVDAAAVPPGLLLAGDAAGFIDPMTGDGLRFAVRGGELAAEAALRALERGWTDVHARLAAARRHEFGTKWRLNRFLRAVAASPLLVHAASAGARLAPSAVRALIARAGDCDVALNMVRAPDAAGERAAW